MPARGVCLLAATTGITHAIQKSTDVGTSNAWTEVSS